MISLEERHANGIFEGRKHVELRRREMKVSVGSTVWIYATLPVGAIVGKAKISELHSLAPSTIWRRFSTVSGLTRAEFFQYFDGISKGFALSLEEVTKLSTPVPLLALRAASQGFQPPQFFMNLDQRLEILRLLQD